MNNMQRGRVTCCMYEIQSSRSFGEGQVSGKLQTRPAGPHCCAERTHLKRLLSEYVGSFLTSDSAGCHRYD
jgi:hypothetical protein